MSNLWVVSDQRQVPIVNEWTAEDAARAAAHEAHVRALAMTYKTHEQFVLEGQPVRIVIGKDGKEKKEYVKQPCWIGVPR